MANNIGKDRIYRIVKENNIIKGELLHKGDLGFHINSPLETLNFFENENIKKVYFIDNRNQPRVINIADPKFNNWTDDQFDFKPEIKLKESVTIKKNTLSSGIFHSGVIQYAFTYFNVYSQETNIFYISSLYYTSFKNRAGSPEEVVNCSFDISLTDLDTKFDYVRIYSIFRTSINGTPVVRKVADIQRSDLINFTDTGVIGEIIDSTHLLYVGGEEIIAETFTQKDNTLFLGNLKLKRPNVGTIEIPNQSRFKNSMNVFELLGNNLGTTLNRRGNYATGTITLESKILTEEIAGGVHYNYNLDSLNTVNPNGNYESFRTLKTNEVYRLGLQFQHASGKWSEPIFLADKTIDLLNSTTPTYDINGNITKVTYNGVKATMTLHDSNYKLISTLVNNKYIKVRPVIVYPNVYERTVVAQGVVNPTLFSSYDRSVGAPYNISSWFFRPVIKKELYYKTGDELTNTYPDLYDPLLYPWSYGSINEFRHHHILPSGASSTNTIYGQKPYILKVPVTTTRTIYTPEQYEFEDGYTNTWDYEGEENEYTEVSITSYLNFHCGYINQEISSLYSARAATCYLNDYIENGVINHSLYDNKQSFIKGLRDNYFIDQNLVTFHSPDVEFDESLINIYNEDLICKVIGFVNLTGFIANKYVNIDGGTWGYPSQGLLSPNIGQINYSENGSNELISFPLLRDMCSYTSDGSRNNPQDYASYVIHPWNAMNTSLIWHSEGQNTAKLEYNKTSNLRYSAFNTYLGNESINYDITPVQLYNSEQTEIIKIKYKNPKIGQVIYQGNIDKLVNQSTNSNLGYPIFGNEKGDNIIATGEIFLGNNHVQISSGESSDKLKYKNIPVKIKYNTTPHLVFGFEVKDIIKAGINLYLQQPILPSVATTSDGITTIFNNQNKTTGIPFWSTDTYVTSQQKAVVNTPYGGLWLVELQRDPNNIKTRFNDGPNGPTKDTLENLKWLPCGEPVSLTDDSNVPLSSVLIQWTDGDTYLQRYDCLKTYGVEADKQSVTEILSFVCETRVNIDGRYDRNRGNKDNTAVTPNKFNLINPVYTQQDNYFTYRALNYDRFDLNSFPNTVTWTKTKVAGELIDPWTSINMLSTIDVNGSLGEITALKTYNSNLLGFQNRGIFSINFNSRVQVPVSDGVPIELSNNYKVDGFRYISTNAGVTNKWAINDESPRGLYFIDDLSKALYSFGQGFSNLSDALGFHSWFTENINLDNKWVPINPNNFMLQYDNIHDYLYITNKDYSLGYSELLNNFGSFYSYNNIPYMFNIWDNFISIQPDTENNLTKLWINNKGEYNKFYGINQPYYITYVVNPEFTKDKFFEILEYRADAINEDGTTEPNPLFNKLSVWNEYQSANVDLLDVNNKPTKTLQCRFRMWRTNIPRVTNIVNNPAIVITRPINSDRMRGTSIFLKLESNGLINKKNILHDIIVYTR